MGFLRTAFRFRNLSPLGAEGRAFLTVALVAVVLALPYLAGISFSDEGYIVHIADRLASGEVLYRDISTGVTPGSFYLHALLFLVFGRTLLVGRLLMMVLFAGASCGVYALCRSVSSRAVALASTLSFVALTVFFWRIPNYSSEAIVMILVATGSIARFLRGGKRAWLWPAGLFLGGAFLFKQNYGVFAALGVTAGLLAAQRPWRDRLRSVVSVAAVAAAPVVLVVACFAAVGAHDELWNDAVMIPLRYTSTIYAHPYPPLFGEPSPELGRDLWSYLPFQNLFLELGHPRDSFFALKLLTARALFYLPPAFLVLAAWMWLRRRRLLRTIDPGAESPPEAHSTAELSIGMLYLASSAFLFLGVFPRSDAFHLVKVLILFFPLLAWVAGPVPGAWFRRAAVAVTAALLVFSIADQSAHVFGRRLGHRRTTFLDLEAAQVWTRASTARQIERLVDEIRRRVPPGEPFLAAPALPLYYFLAGRPNPTRYPLVLPGGLDQEEVVRALDAKSVRLVLAEDRALGRYSFSEVTPIVWERVVRDYGPAGPGDWTAPPYLLSKGPTGLPSSGVLLRGVAAATGTPRVEEGPFDPRGWVTTHSLVHRAVDEPPLSEIVGLHSRRRSSRTRAAWTSVFLRPALQMIAPLDWRKTLVSWEVPAEPGLHFEAACALSPARWANPDAFGEGKGGIAEIWVGPAGEGAVPVLIWTKWLDPRRRPEDRRWHLVAVDLASLVSTPRARVTLVARSSPTFEASDAVVAWSGIRLARPEVTGPVAEQGPLGPVPEGEAIHAGVLLEDAAIREITSFSRADLDLAQRGVAAFPDDAGAHEALGVVAIFLGENELALEACQSVVGLGPDDGSRPLRRVTWLLLKEHLAQFLPTVRSGAGASSTPPDFHLAVAALHRELGHVDEAMVARRRFRVLPLLSAEELARITISSSGFEGGDLSQWSAEGQADAAAGAPNDR